MMSEHAKHMRWRDTTRHAKHVPEEGGEREKGEGTMEDVKVIVGTVRPCIPMTI